MFPHALQFQLSAMERDLAVLLPHQLLCLRQTAQTLEFLWRTTNGSTNVLCVSGMNLGLLRRAILHGTTTTIQCGAFGPYWGQCFVSNIRHCLGWTRVESRLARDPNTVPDQFWQLETGQTRDLWRYDDLARFAIPRCKEEKFLLQFDEQHAYVLQVAPNTFNRRLAQLKKANFKFGAGNRFTVFVANPFPPFPTLDLSGHSFEDITYAEKNLANRSDWEVLLDFRQSSLAPTRMEIGL